MGGEKNGYLALGIALGFMGALAAFIWLNSFAQHSYCGQGENYGACFREWFGALSGWAAAGAAGITIFALYDQIKEQRKQSDFVLGEALPTFDAYAEDFIDVYLRVVNWNRRTFIIDKITCTDADSIHVLEVKLEHKKKPEFLKDDKPEFWQPVRVAAFDDRSKAPAICRIELQIFSGEGPKLRTFKVHGRLLGEEHREQILTAKAYVMTVSTGP